MSGRPRATADPAWPGPRQADFLCAAAAGVASFAVYLRTLAPGLVATFDTPMFQFVGRVLGVPHNPGYPLYVWLTWAFSYVPVGTLAYRINLFSALCGGLTVALVVLVARELGCRRPIATAAGLALAFGPVFWSQAIIAEVYTLDTAIVAAMLLALLAWGRTRRSLWFYAAVALLGAGLGNHTTILGFAPGIAIYALAVDRRFALRGRTAAVAAALVGLGLLQYVFVLVRSQQPGVYAESHASTLPELLQVMSGAQFRNDLFAFDWRTVLTAQLPLVVGRIVVPELTVVGCLLGAAGLAWLVRRRPAAAVLLASGAVAIVAFALNYAVVDLQVFLIPALLVGWLLAGVGAEALAALAERRLRPTAGAAVGLSMLVLAGAQGAVHFDETDRSRDVEDAIQLDRLFETLPDRTAILNEDFLVDRMVAFELLGRHAADGREIVQVPADEEAIDGLLQRGFTVVGFPKAADRLRQHGFDFAFAPLPLTEPSLGGLLRRLPEGTVVALAVPALHSSEFAARVGDALTFVGGPEDLHSRAGTALAIVGTRGGHAGAAIESGRRAARAVVHAGDLVGGTRAVARASFDVEAGAEAAVIRQDGREILRTTRGAALVCWLPDGRRSRVAALEAAGGFQVPIPAGPLSVYRLSGRWESQQVPAGRWIDVRSATQTGSVLLRVPAGGSLVLYAADDGPLAPRVVEQWSAGHVDIRTVRPGEAGTEMGGGPPLEGSRPSAAIARIEVSAAASGLASVLVALGGVAASAVARTSDTSADVASVFRVDTHDLLRRGDSGSMTLLMANDDQTLLAGAGWSAIERDAVGSYRWMMADQARLMLPVTGPLPQRIRVQALLDGGDGRCALRLQVNGAALPPRPLEDGWHVYEWTLPAGGLRPGTNDVMLLIDRGPSAGGASPGPVVAVSDVHLDRAAAE